MVKSARSIDVIVDKLRVVHFVDMIAGKDDDIFGAFFLDRVDILVDGVGRALVPFVANSLLRWDDIDEFAQFTAEVSSPSSRNMPVETHCLILGQRAATCGCRC